MDDTFTIIQRTQKDAFLEHINSIDDNIHFTVEYPREDGSIAFLDMLITPDEDGRLNSTVYRKPSDTDQYLHWDSHHTITSKYNMIGNLCHRARTICSFPSQLQKEYRHLFKSLRKCKYPNYALNRAKLKKNKENISKPAPTNSRIPKLYIVVSYHQELSESFKRTSKRYGIEVHLKGGHIIKDLLMVPKDKDPILKKVESYIDINVTGWIVMKNI